MFPSTMTFVDIETTGLSPLRDRIIELGIIRVEGGKIVDTFDSLINPDCSVSSEISGLTGIHSWDLENAPTFHAIRHRIKEMLSESIFVAHNARFDYSFIRSEFNRLDESFTAKLLCTASLSRKLYPKERHHNLDRIIERFHLTCTQRHRAMGDAQVLWDFVQKIQKAKPLPRFASALSTVLKNPTLPPAISRSYIDTLPQTHGVYIFYDQAGAPLYIGKSINIKDRVLTHFQNALTNPKEAKIFHSVASIDAIKTQGELSALLLESRLIKEQKPMFNRMLRKTESLIGLVQDSTKEGYNTVKSVDLKTVRIENISNVLAIFRSQKQLKNALSDLSDTHLLCKKLLGLEKTTKACFGTQIEKCNGACIGAELPAKYNLRVLESFARTKVRTWPFNEPMVLVEGNYGIVVSMWCVIGDIRDGEFSATPSDEMQFDLDTYKILSSYLLHKSNKIKLYPYSKYQKQISSYN